MEGIDFMSKFMRCFILVAAIVTAWSGVQPAAAQQTSQFNDSKIIDSLLPTVVSIRKLVAASEPGGNPKIFYGSGFVIDPSGLIVTNDHVIAGAFDLQVTFSDGQTAPAKLVATAPMIDIAVIKADTQRQLTAIRWGDSNKLTVGEPVIAIGNPLGLGMSVSTGIVSALNRNINGSPYDDYIQTDASINHGNSGGPMFDRTGLVVGMDTAIISPTQGSVGLGFAQPSRDVQFVVERLIRDGFVKAGWAGASVDWLTPELAQAFGLKQPGGAIIAGMVKGGPAESAGAKVGDVVLKFGDTVPMDARQLKRLVAQSEVGKAVPVTIWRNGQQRVVNMTIKEFPITAAQIRANTTEAAAPKVAVPADLGLALSAINQETRAKYGLDVAQTGVVITGVANGTDAALRGVATGDVILRVQDQLVQTPEAVQTALGQVRAQRQAFAALLLMKKGQAATGPSWLALRVSPGQ
jgi:serine protease Do